MTCISKALIVGGGIAGLSSAIALSRAGVHCDVVELTGTETGASIGITGRAADALGELGVYDDCLPTSRPFPRDTTVTSQFDADGRLLSPGPARPDWPGSKVGLGVYRPAFLKVLLDAARREGANVRIGLTARSIDEQDGGALVWLSDNTQHHYDLVIGADGIGSSVRPLKFPDAPEPAYSGQFSMRWMISGTPMDEEGWYSSDVGPLGFYNLPQRLTYVAAVLDVAEKKHMEKAEVHARFAELLDSFRAPAIKELRRRLTADAQIIARPFEWVMMPRPWHRGCTLLIGDAAHATTAHLGMGGGMALEDAVVLGQCVANAQTLAQALDEFMERRYARVKTVVDTSLALCRLELSNAPRTEAVGLMKTTIAVLAESY